MKSAVTIKRIGCKREGVLQRMPKEDDNGIGGEVVMKMLNNLGLKMLCRCP